MFSKGGGLCGIFHGFFSGVGGILLWGMLFSRGIFGGDVFLRGYFQWGHFPRECFPRGYFPWENNFRGLFSVGKVNTGHCNYYDPQRQRFFGFSKFRQARF